MMLLFLKFIFLILIKAYNFDQAGGTHISVDILGFLWDFVSQFEF